MGFVWNSKVKYFGVCLIKYKFEHLMIIEYSKIHNLDIKNKVF